MILNIFPNHSERYRQVIDYAMAKFRMLNNMNEKDFLILGTENEYLNQLPKHQVPTSTFSKGNLPQEFSSLFSFEKARVKGEHNEANFYAAYKTLSLLGITDLPRLFQQFIDSFSGVSHRLEFVVEKNGLKVYNDAKSTNILATTTAIKAFKDSTEPLYLILGGKLRSEDDRLITDLLPFKNRIAGIFTIGEVTERLYEELGSDFKIYRAYDIKTALKMALEKKLNGYLVFSPSFPSFDQFKNYIDRGEKFKAALGEWE